MIYLVTNQSYIENDSDEVKIATIQDCYNYCSTCRVLGLDIETTRKYNKYFEIEGLDPYTSKIVMLQIGDVENQYIIDTRNVNIDILKPILIDKEVQLVGHNIKFEYKHILHNYNIRINNLYDTMIVEQILYNGLYLKNSLNDLNQRYLDIKVDKSTRLQFLDIKDKSFTFKQIKYGAEDIVHPLLIKYEQEQEILDTNVSTCVKLEMSFLEVLGEIEYKGINFNKEIWLKTYNDNLIEFNKYKNILDKFVIENYPDSEFIERQLDLFSSEVKCNIKWTSSKQVIEFFIFLGICPKEVSKTTKKLSYTVNAKVVRSSLATTNKDVDDITKKFILEYLMFKELEQSCTTFGKDFLKYINPITNRVHSNYKQILSTGRISSSGPNLQNIPSEDRFRQAFDSPEGYNIVNADYSGQENICLANSSMDPDILNFYYEGHSDMHSYNAKKIFTELNDLSLDEVKKQHPDKRQIAKSVSFALAYGGNGYTISNNLGISPEEGERIYQSYFDAFPQLKKFFDRTIEESMKRGYIIIDPVTNRRYYFKYFKKLKYFKEQKNWKQYFTLKGKYERSCLNYIIQGAAGSITKLAAIYFKKWILDQNLQNDVFITNLVHDEINVESLEQYSSFVANGLEESMKKAGEVWCKTIPLNAEAAIGTYWTH